jgi:nitroimidazol reductase NimA-like FMN-containing flavoprotein (pyridoxamine 5'-phosphate oxidase superfamily)
MRVGLSSEEIREYLARPLLARLATSDAGWPHVVPVWFEFDGETFWIPAQAKTVKVEHIRRDKRVGLIIDTYAEPMSKFNITQVMVKGEAELVRDHDLETNPAKSRTISVYHRYLGKESENSEFVSKLLTVDRFLIKVSPVRIVALREQW